MVLLLGVHGQELIAPGSPAEQRAADLFRRLVDPPAGRRLECAVNPFPARLGYTLRFWAGYEVTLPVPLDPATEGTLAIALRVTPEGGAARYFASRLDYANLPSGVRERRRLQLYTSGGVALGVGQYAATLLVIDAAERFCRKSWRITAKDSRAPERIAPGVVEENRFERWTGFPPKPSNARLTVFLHVAPVWWRRNAVRLSPWDRGVLLGCLVSLLDTSRFGRARLIAYNLDARKVLLRAAEFDEGQFRRLVQAMEGLNLGQVDASSLREDPQVLLRELIEEETQRERADAVVFLGPLSRYMSKPDPRLRELSQQLPPSFGLVLWPPPGQGDDIVSRLGLLRGGRTVRIYNPADLAKAIRLVDGN